jgi:hypothetical protein
VINSLVRTADLNDHQQLSNLIFFETRLHRHLDWRSPLEWLGAPFYWAWRKAGMLLPALACPTEVEAIAWVRLFVYTGRWSPEDAWILLWATARETIARGRGKGRRDRHAALVPECIWLPADSKPVSRS